MNANRTNALVAGVCALLLLALFLPGCTRPKPVASVTPSATAPPATAQPSPEATQSLGTPPATPAEGVTPSVEESAVPTPVPPVETPEATPVPTEPPAEPGVTTYTIQAGDTLYSLAARFGTTAEEIAALNGISLSAMLYVGQTLQLPGSATEPPNVHIVQPGENLYRIALRYGTTWQELAQLNNIYDPTQLRVGQQLLLPGGVEGEQPTPSSGSGVHVVQPGDTLYGLAAQYGVSVEALAQANGLTIYSLLYVGQELTIP